MKTTSTEIGTITLPWQPEPCDHEPRCAVVDGRLLAWINGGCGPVGGPLSADLIALLNRGQITITPDGGQPVTLRPGDAFVVEPTFKGTWKIEAPVRKHFAIKLK